MSSTPDPRGNDYVARQIARIVADDIDRKLQWYVKNAAKPSEGISEVEVADLDLDAFAHSLEGLTLDDKAMQEVRTLGADDHEIVELLPLWAYGVTPGLRLTGDMPRITYSHTSK